MAMDPLDPRNLWKQQARRIQNLQRALANPSAIAIRINKRLVVYAQAIIEDRFMTQGASAGVSWAPLKATTIRERARLGFAAGPTLVRSGTLANAARNGRIQITADQITITLKDGGAPVYTGSGPRQSNGQFGRKRVNRKAARQIDDLRAQKLSTAGMHSGRLSDYVDGLNAKRPFYGKPTPQELAPMIAERDKYIAAVVNALANGQSLSSAGI